MSTPAPSAAGRVLVVNAGSSSLKLHVLDPADAVTARADLPAPRGAADDSQIKSAIETLYKVKVAKVNTKIVRSGKIATITFTKDFSAEDIGSRAGVF